MHVRIDSARTRGSALEKSIAEFVLGKNSSIKSEFDSGLEEGEINEGVRVVFQHYGERETTVLR